MHKCKCLNPLCHSNAIWHHEAWLTLVQIMTCCPFVTKPLPEPIQTYCRLDPFSKIWIKLQWFSFQKRTTNCFQNFFWGLNEFTHLALKPDYFLRTRSTPYMAADALAPNVARLSATMTLIDCARCQINVLAFYEKYFNYLYHLCIEKSYTMQKHIHKKNLVSDGLNNNAPGKELIPCTHMQWWIGWWILQA